MVNEEFWQLFPKGTMQHLDWARSDHRPIMFEGNSKRIRNDTNERGRRIFRFEEAWTQHADCNEMITKLGCWEDRYPGFSRLENCLKICQDRLHKWGKSMIGNIRHHIAKLKTTLQDLYKKHPPWDFTQIKKIESQLDKAMEEEEIYWKQRSSENWLQWGDRNTRWFHKRATMRKRRNEIQGIRDESGVWISDRKELDHAFENYFVNMFTSSNPSVDIIDNALQDIQSTVTPAMNDRLLAPFTRDGIERAIKQMHPTKAPGPDGFPALCFINSTGTRLVIPVFLIVWKY